MMIVLTKADLISDEDENGENDDVDGRLVTYRKIRETKDKHGMQGCCKTSAKEWEDFNVHKAFVRTICAGYFSKYDAKLGDPID